MDNRGKLLEAWIATCAACGEECVLHWDNGTHMSKSQAMRIITIEEGWENTEFGLICPACN